MGAVTAAPSAFVEKRFGISYTLSFGNWKALITPALLVASLIALSIVAVLGALEGPGSVRLRHRASTPLHP